MSGGTNFRQPLCREILVRARVGYDCYTRSDDLFEREATGEYVLLVYCRKILPCLPATLGTMLDSYVLIAASRGL